MLQKVSLFAVHEVTVSNMMEKMTHGMFLF